MIAALASLDPVTWLLLWFAIGAVIWALTNREGVVYVLSTAALIAGWPCVVVVWLRDRREDASR
jgi:hypothetical protein